VTDAPLAASSAASSAARMRALEAIESVADPEIPVLSVVDLGIVREVRVDGDAVEVTVTPTYSGCPATEVIEESIRRALARAGFAATVRTVLSPAWTTDWMTASGRAKLERFGIAPPGPRAPDAPAPLRFYRAEPALVGCPHCGGVDTERLAEFGSTACKALYRCRICREPFDYFKPI
jgi:ring-1,2-phenylacetyl-CoA epoxidase subunit PaaD